MSSLATQLAARTTLDSARLSSATALKYPPSFIYTPRHAASVTTADLHATASNAWEQLSAIDPFFEEYQNRILGEEAKGTDRSALTKDENEKLGKVLDTVLRALGKHMLLKPAGIVLEWLVRRFRVNDLNAGEVIALFLPYHTTTHFASGLQLVSEPVLANSIFVSLTPTRKSLAPLPLDALVSFLPPFSSVPTARPFLDFVLQLPLAYLRAEEKPHRALVGVWLQAVAGYLERAKNGLPAGEAAAVLSTILEVLRLSRTQPDPLIASYILLARYSLHNPFSEETLRVVMKTVVTNRARAGVADEETDAAFVTTLVVIAQLGVGEIEVKEGKLFLGGSGWQGLTRIDKLDDLLVRLCNQYDAERFMMPFLKTLASQATTDAGNLELLSSLLRPRLVSSDAQTFIPDRIVALLTSSTLSVLLSDDATSSGLTKVPNQVYQRWPTVWEAETKLRLAAASEGAAEGQESPAVTKLMGVMNAVLGGGSAIGSGSSTAVFLSSTSPDSAVRLIAVRKLLATTDAYESDPTFVHDTLLARLAEPDAAIVGTLLSTPAAISLLHTALDADEIFDTLARLLASDKLPLGVAKVVLAYLAGPYLLAHPTRADAVLIEVFWGRLLVGKSNAEERVAAYKALVGSRVDRHVWTQGVAALLPLDWDPKTVKMPATAAASNAAIVAQIVSNVVALPTEESAAFSSFLLRSIAMVPGDITRDEPSFTVGSAKVLSLLVCAQLAPRLAPVDQVTFVADILVALGAGSSGLEAISGTDGKALHDAQMQLDAALAHSVCTHAQSGKTLRRLRGAVVSMAVASLRPVPGSTWSWLAGKATLEVAAYRNLATSIYHLANTAPEKATGALLLARSLMTSLFVNLLQDDALAFLASIWTSASSSDDVKALALRDAAVVIAARAAKVSTDFQMLIPALLLAMLSDSVKVRSYAMAALTAVGSSLPSTPAEVYGRDEFYGPTSDSVQYLGLADIGSYIQQVVDRKTELSVDGAYLRAFHEKVLTSPAETKKKATLTFKFSTFVISHVASWPDVAARAGLLRVLSGITDPVKGAMLIPVLAQAAQTSHKHRVELFEGVPAETVAEYARLLLQPYVGASRKWLESAETKALSVLFDTLEIKDATGPGAVLRKEALVIARASVFSTIRGDNRSDLFRRLVRLAVVPESRYVADVLECLRGCLLDSTTITAFLNEVRVSFAGPVSKGAKRGRTSLGNAGSRSDRLSELVVVLESVEFKTIAVTHGLILALFELLSSLLEIAASAQVDIQYAGQLMLATLSKVVENVKPDSGITSDSIRMSPVLDLMRASTNPQTSHQALLLLAQLGPLVPDQLVHNVMPIFTFMGANVLQRDDAYSLRVVERTLESIVPALVKSMKVSSTGREALVKDLRDLLRVFTDAAAHVPRHRRTKLFVRFVDTLGAGEFLSAVTMLLLDHADQTSEGTVLPLSLVESFAVDVQLSAFNQIIHESASLLKGRPDTFLDQKVGADAGALEQAVSLISFLAMSLEAKQLVAKVDAARAADTEGVETSLTQIVRGLLDISALPLAGASAATIADVANATSEALQSAVRLMSTQSFSEAILWLLELADPVIRSSALVLLRSRLPTVKVARRGDVSPAVLAVLAKVQSALEDTTSAETESALVTLEAVVSSVHDAEDAALAKTVPVLLDVASRDSSSESKAVVLSILKKLSNRLGSRLIPLAAKIIPFAVRTLQQEALDVELASQKTVTNSFEILEGLFTSIPTFIGGQLDNVFAACLSEEIMSLTSIKDSAAAKARAALLSTASRKLPAKTVYPAIIRLHEKLDGERKEPVLGLLDILNRALRQGKTVEIAENYKPIFKLFLSIFDLRRVHSASLSLEDISSIEENALGAFVQFILKLNETTFKPLFLRTYDWAVIDLADEDDASSKFSADLTARRTVLFKIVDRLLVQLKSIMVPFFSFMLEQTVDLLESFAGGDLRDSTLWSAVVSALSKALEYDETGFWTPLRLGKLTSPIALQLSSPHALSTQLLAGGFNPLLGRFSSMLSSSEPLLKAFNTSLLMLTRSDDLRTKRTALESLEVVWDTLGDGMLGLVPETTPFLAETIEESEGGVESTTRRLIKRIEEHLGESLEDYLGN